MYVKNNEQSSEQKKPQLVVVPDNMSQIIQGLVKPEADVEEIDENNKIDLKKARRFRRNLEMMRKNTLYILEIQVHVGRGASAIRLDFEDLGIPERTTEAMKAERVKPPQIVPFEELKHLSGELRAKREAIQNKWMFFEGTHWFVPEKFLEQVATGVEELFEAVKKLRGEAIASYEEGKLDFLHRLARIALSVNPYITSSDMEKFLNRYVSEFPSKAEIANNFRVSIGELLKLPTLTEQAQEDAGLAAAEAEYAAAQVKIQETESVKKLQKWYFDSVQQSLSETVESARDKFYGILADLLKDISEAKTDTLSAGRQRRLDNKLQEIEKLFQAIDFEAPLGELAQKVTSLKTLAVSSHTKKDDLEQGLNALKSTLKQEFSFLSEESGKGHLALAQWMNFELDLTDSE